MTNDLPQATVVALNGASKSFGAVLAIDGINFHVSAGECVGLIGHNGAGKSTLVNIINGGLRQDEGTISLAGKLQTHYSIGAARSGGVRCVFQELSLCPNLTVVENTRITHASLYGWGWRSRALSLIKAKLDDIFPEHTIDCHLPVGDLSIAERQMVEIATAFTRTKQPLSLVILDEPTSSLDFTVAANLIAFVRRFVSEGGSVVFISHILAEVIKISDRIVVMKDGAIVDDDLAGNFTASRLVEVMGSVVQEQTQAGIRNFEYSGAAPIVALPEMDFKAFPGEVLGLAGLSGHGQTDALVTLFMQKSGDWRMPKNPNVAFVAGDRHVDGIFALWSILRNISVSMLPDLTGRLFISRSREADLGRQWQKRISIRTGDMENPVLSLSGGNQQKVLFSRALATRAPVVLMDDPMRGVDIGTKQEVYQMVRSEAEGGRTFVWYSTEMDEVCQCDRVYVFSEGEIVAELKGDAVNEANVLSASFGETA